MGFCALVLPQVTRLVIYCFYTLSIYWMVSFLYIILVELKPARYGMSCLPGSYCTPVGNSNNTCEFRSNSSSSISLSRRSQFHSQIIYCCRYDPAMINCRQCSSGKFSLFGDVNYCFDCPPGNTSPIGATACSPMYELSYSLFI